MSEDSHVAVITGAAAGIGRATAQRLADAGSRLVLVDVDEQGLGRATDELRGAGRLVEPVVGSVTDADLAVQVATTAIETYGRLDHLVNSAGVLDGYAPLEETSLLFLQRVVDINVFGAFNFCKAVMPAMAKAGYGKIVNMASIASFIGDSGGVGYTVSKHALIGLTRHLASTHGPAGVRTNAICPGVIPTELRGNSGSCDSPVGAGTTRM